MKIVINACFGGFSLSPRAIKRLAELNGRQCFFFTTGRDSSGSIDIDKHVPVTLEELESQGRILFFHAFDIPNPAFLNSHKKWWDMTEDERIGTNKKWDAHSLDRRPKDRTDPKLIQVIEELGDAANGSCAELKVIEIPDGTDWEIGEYDGNESVHEKHESWS